MECVVQSPASSGFSSWYPSSGVEAKWSYTSGLRDERIVRD